MTEQHTIEPVEQPTRKKRRKWPWVIAAVAVIGVIVGVSSGGGTAAEDEPSRQGGGNHAAEKPEQDKPEFTVAQTEAIEAAQQYVDTMPFSRAGLVDQMTSEYGSGFTQAQAEFAINHIDVDWNAEAVEAAESYLDTMAFSRAGLIDQLTSPYGSQFTMDQAVHAANQVGLR